MSSKSIAQSRIPLPALRHRLASALLVPTLLLTSSPVTLLVAAAEPPPKPVAASTPKPAEPPEALQVVPPTPNVKPNRATPKVSPPGRRKRFSENPENKEIAENHVLPRGLAPDASATRQKNARFARFLESFVEREQGAEDAAQIAEFLSANPNSGWDTSLYANLGQLYYKRGQFSKALDAWENAWSLGKSATDPKLKALVDDAVGQLAKMNARIGRFERLEPLLAEVKGRQISGPATEMIAGAAEGLWLMKNEPGRAFRCGPMAVGTIARLQLPNKAPDLRIHSALSTQRGTSLTQVSKLAADIGLTYQMAKRRPGAPVIVPSIVNWKVGHFAALTQRKENRTLIEDPTFGDRIWIQDHALDAEASGYFLVPSGRLPDGWEKVSDVEGNQVWGKGDTGSTDPDPTKKCDTKTDCACSSNGMAVYSAHLAVVSLNIVDTPMFYSTPRGPAVEFKATYSQRDANQPSSFYYSNLGPKWTFDWLSYISDSPDYPEGDVRIYLRGGGVETYSGFNSATNSYAPQLYSQAVLVRVGTANYERRMPDGSKEIYDIPDGTTTSDRRVFLRQIVDPAGNTQTYTMDGSFRIIAVTDAIGQVSTLSYDMPSDPLKITRVTDPFGRFASFEYTDGQLTKITDMIGITSEFQYTGDFIHAMTTPYGISKFAYGDVSTEAELHQRTRWLEMTDPMGGKERIEFNELTNIGMPRYLPPGDLPSGLVLRNNWMFARNTYYWDKKAMMTMGNEKDYEKARLYHWQHYDGYAKSGSIIESEKPPLGSRIWYNYPGQLPGEEGATLTGTMNKPNASARVLSSGETQLVTKEYNEKGNATKVVDPLGRETTYLYAANGIDILETRNTTNGLNELLSASTYNAAHQPLTTTDAGGQVITNTYNAFGQMLTSTVVRNGLNETTTWIYDINGYLQSVTRPVVGATESFTYDGFGRLRTTTDSEGYTVTIDYDALDRVVKVTFPDGTYVQTIYTLLDPEWTRDRSGRWTHFFYDRMRRLARTDDAAGRSTVYDWCVCGALHAIKDGEGRTTRFAYDLAKRLIQKTYHDGSAVQFSYDTARGLMTTRVDAQGRTTNYAYNLNDDIEQISYTGGAVSTPTVSFTYDPDRNRKTSMTDGTGTTNYGYYPISSGTLGAGKLASVDGPGVNDTVSYGYDELGRVISSSVNAVAETTSWDALGRVSTMINPLGSFGYSYVNTTGRMSAVTYPNGQISSYDYYPNASAVGTGNGDQRLKAMWHELAGGTALSSHEYGYNVAGEISSWQRQTDSNPQLNDDIGYDAASELLSVTRTDVTSGAVQKQFSYVYDKAGNRTVEQVDNMIAGGTYNVLNQLTARIGAGAMDFEGTVSEPSTVTVGGNPAPVDGNNRFKGRANVSPGVQSVEIKATDASGNITTKHAQFTAIAGAPTQSFSYDTDGNLTSDGLRSFAWDAENRLVKITIGADDKEYVYNGVGQRVAEKMNGSVTKRWIWDDYELREERNASNGVVKRYFHQGVVAGAALPAAATDKLFYAGDHLGSIRELTDSTGAIRARYDYDEWGNRTKLSGDLDSDLAYTRHYWDSFSGVYLTYYRQYDPSLGRWLSRDPLEDAERRVGTNLYSMVGNDVVNSRDSLGLYPIYWTPEFFPDSHYNFTFIANAYHQMDKEKYGPATVIWSRPCGNNELLEMVVTAMPTRGSGSWIYQGNGWMSVESHFAMGYSHDASVAMGLSKAKFKCRCR